MPFPFLAAAAAAVPSIFQGVSGAIQAAKGRRMAKNNIRPTYARPNEINTALALAENNFHNGGMPGSTGIKNQIDSGYANSLDMAIQAASSSGDVQDAITKLDYNRGKQYNDVATQEASFKQQQLEDYKKALMVGAGYSDKEFAYNKDQPYQDTAAAASALIEGGNINAGNAANGLSSLGTMALMNDFQKTQQVDIFNQGLRPDSLLSSLQRFKPLSPDAGKINFTSGLRKLVYDPTTGQVKPQF